MRDIKSQFSSHGGRNDGQAALLGASLDFMVDPQNEQNKQALISAYDATRPEDKAILSKYLDKVAASGKPSSAPPAGKHRPGL